MDLLLELQQKIQELLGLSRVLEQYGAKYANAEHQYKVAISKEVMILKESGMAVTLINLVVYGRPSVAKLRLERDLAEVLYDACKEKINILKVAIRVLENQIQVEKYERN